jgi:hypothetical protein
VYIYNEYLALKKEGNSTTCYTVNEAWDIVLSQLQMKNTGVST